MMGAPMLLDDEVVGVLPCGGTRSPFDEREMAIVSAFAAQAAIAVSTIELVQRWRRGAPSWPSKVDQLEALREVGEAVSSSLDLDEVLSTIASTRSSCRAPTAARSWSTTKHDRCFLVRSVHRTEPEPSCDSCGASGSASTRRWSGGRATRAPAAAGPGPRRGRPRPAPADPVRRRLAVRGSRCRCSGKGRSSAPSWCGARRPATSPTRPRAAADVRQPVGARDPQRPAVPRAGGHRASSWRWPAGTSRSSWPACRTSCGRR